MPNIITKAVNRLTGPPRETREWALARDETTLVVQQATRAVTFREGFTSDQINEWLSRVGLGSSTPPYSTFYRSSSPVYRSVKLRADAIARGRPKVYMPDRDGRLEWVGENDPVQRLLDRVQTGWTRSRMWIAVETNLCIWGESYRWINRGLRPSSPEAWEIVVLKPSYVKPVVEAGVIVGYLYDAGGNATALLPDEVIYDRYYNPADLFRGLSPLEAGMTAAGMNRDMLAYNRMFFRNGVASNMIIYLDQATQPEVERVREQFADRYAGTENAHRPIVSTRQGMIQSLPVSNREMEFISGIALSKNIVADVFGVPEELFAGSEHSTFANREAATREFYGSTVAMEWSMLESELQEQFIPMLPPRYSRAIIRFDRDAIGQLQETREERYTREVRQTEAGHLTRNEVRAGYDRDPLDGGDVWSTAPTGDLLLAGPPVPPDRGVRALPAYRALNRTQIRLLQAFQRDFRFLSAGFEASLEPVFEDLGLRAEQAYKRIMGLRQLQPGDEELIDAILAALRIEQWEQSTLTPAFDAHYRSTLTTTVDSVNAVLNLSIGTPDSVVQRVIQEGGTNRGLIDCNGQARRSLFRAIEQGRELGEGVDALARRIRSQVPAGPFPQAGPRYRSRVIARTETLSAQRHSQIEAYSASAVVSRVVAADDQLGYGDADCSERNGKVFTFEEAREEQALEHPNGTLMWLPLVDA